MMAVKSLTQLRDLVEADLTDSSNSTWSTAEIDRAIRRALFRYSEVRPMEAVTTLTAAHSREYTHAISGLLGVRRVWWPYDSSDPDALPTWVDFELWDDNTILYLKVDECPQVGDDPLRVFYTKQHTLNGLDSATVSTYYEEDEEVLVLGATAFAAMQRVRYTIDAVNATAEVPANFKAWANARMKEFEDELKRIGRKVVRNWDNRVAMLVDV